MCLYLMVFGGGGLNIIFFINNSNVFILQIGSVFFPIDLTGPS